MSFYDDGYQLLDSFIPAKVLQTIRKELSGLQLDSSRGGIRNPEKKLDSVSELVTANWLTNQACHFLSGQAQFVRAILFIKSPESNWRISWHQDKTVAVSKRFEGEGWRSWSVKDSIQHVQAPIRVLDKMICIRIHIDDSFKDNGCLKVLPGSHKSGLLSKEAIRDFRKDTEAVCCEGPAGSALVMRPHLLHSSAKSTVESNRRVLHLEYCSYQLPNGVGWA